jgi:hypothetical protein
MSNIGCNMCSIVCLLPKRFVEEQARSVWRCRQLSRLILLNCYLFCPGSYAAFKAPVVHVESVVTRTLVLCIFDLDPTMLRTKIQHQQHKCAANPAFRWTETGGTVSRRYCAINRSDSLVARHAAAGKYTDQTKVRFQSVPWTGRRE